MILLDLCSIAYWWICIGVMIGYPLDIPRGRDHIRKSSFYARASWLAVIVYGSFAMHDDVTSENNRKDHLIDAQM